MARNPWVLPDGFDADVQKALRAIRRALKKSGKSIPEEALLQLQAGNIDGFLEFVNWEQIRAGFGDLEAALTSAARRAGTSTYTLGGIDAQLLFNMIDERAVTYARERGSQLIVEIADQMRETVRETIAAAQRGEMTYQQAAIRLQTTVPLSSRDAEAVSKYINKQFERFMRQGLSEAKARIKAQNMGARYGAKLLDSRTRTIARTEIIDASMSGRYLGWESGVSAGYIASDSVKEWIAEPDACPICRPLDGTIIGWNDSWAFPDGVRAGSNDLMPPAHPNCRCSVVILPPDFSDNVFTPASGGEMPDEASEFMKHMLGLHDQGKHAGRRVAGVPENIDLDGKRWNEDSRRELGARKQAYENRRIEIHNELCQETLGASWDDLPEYGDPVPTPDFMRGSRYDNNGQIDAGKSVSRSEEFWAKVDSDPSVLAARDEYLNHFTMRDAANLESVAGGTIGDNYNITDWNSPLAKLGHLSGFGNETDPFAETDGLKALQSLSQPDAKVFPDPYIGVSVGGSNLTRQQAIEVANQDWQTFMSEGQPQIIMSAASAQRVLSSERVKTIHEIDRPARAGGSDDSYKDTRRVYENAAFGYNDSTPVSSRPVSGILGSGEPYSESLNIYGGKNPAVITLKPSVRDRTTYTSGDSLNGFLAPKPLNNPPSFTGINRSVATAGAYKAATGRNWFADNKINAPEIQIHGGVSIGDIAGITFYGRPSASVLATVQRKGIPYTIETPTMTSGLTDD